MIIFASMLVPFVTAAFLWLKFKHKMTWWEWLLPFLASLILSSIFYACSLRLAQRDEFWTGWLTQVAYYEDWNEEVFYTETYYCGSDSKGNPQYCTRIASRIDYHPAYWMAYGSNGESYDITQFKYQEFMNRWGNSKFVELGRNYHSNDGNKYLSVFNGKNEDLEVINSIHRYENKVALSKSVFNPQPVSKNDKAFYQLLEYPRLTEQWKSPSILGYQPNGWHEADRDLQVFNAKHGATNEVRVWILVFKNQTLEAGYAQQNYWKNANMNEFVLCVGLNEKDEVSWGHVFSWLDDSTLNVEGRNYIDSLRGQQISLLGMVDWVEQKIPTGWQRKDFEKDFGYLQIQPPSWMVILSFSFAFLANVGVACWVVTNEFEEATA